MDFTEPDELSMLRETLRRLLSSFGHSYYVERTRAGKLDALWRKMARASFSA